MRRTTPESKPLQVVELHPDGSPVAEHVDVAFAPDDRVQVDLVLVDPSRSPDRVVDPTYFDIAQGPT